MTDTVLDQSACTNCGTRLTGMFCAHCGRKADAGPPTMREFLRDGAEELFDVNGKVLRTLRALFLRPGFMTRELFEGRRVSYVGPLRLYLVCSVAALGVMALTAEAGLAEGQQSADEQFGELLPRFMFVFVFGTVMLYGLL